MARPKKEKIGDVGTGIIKYSEFIKEWISPQKSVIYYHRLQFEDGKIINIGKKEKNPAIFLPGNEFTYKVTNVDANGKSTKWTTYIPYGGNNETKKQVPKTRKTTPKKVGGKPVKKEDFIGYAMSYAKDLVVAGKTSKTDTKNLLGLFETIYGLIEEKIDEYNKEKTE